MNEELKKALVVWAVTAVVLLVPWVYCGIAFDFFKLPRYNGLIFALLAGLFYIIVKYGVKNPPSFDDELPVSKIDDDFDKTLGLKHPSEKEEKKDC
ncbi:MAG: hypothetical protein MJY87_02010 [Fibrobacter sp.]|nr:hypothetical protein [Fibrobacter sp.]